MPARPKDRSPHRIGNVEHSMALGRPLSTFSKGDLVVRQGTPCLVVEVAARAGGEDVGTPLTDTVWLANLTNGSVWPASALDQVHPAYDANLTYSTTRRES